MNNIKKLRGKAGLTKTDLARKAGVDRRAIENAEKETTKRKTALATYGKIAKGLGCDIDDLGVDLSKCS